MGGNVPAPFNASRVQNIARSMGPAGYRQFTRDWAAFNNGQTAHVTLPAPAAFEAVRILFGNDTTTAYTISGLKVVASATAANPWGPQDASGNALTNWVAGTFGGAATGTVPAQAASVPSAPATLASDWITVSSLDRADESVYGLPLLMLRVTFGTGGGRALTQPTNNIKTDWQQPSVNLGRTWRCANLSGDYVTNTNQVTGWVENDIPVIWGIQFKTRTRVITVQTSGDSQFQARSLNIAARAFGWPHVAVSALSTARRPISLVNSGWSGNTAALINQRGKADIDFFQPSVVVIQANSQNDGTTQPICAAGYASAIDLAYYALSKGAVPILVPNFPGIVWNSTTEPNRQAIRAKVLAMAPGIPVFDAEGIISDGSNPARIKAAYDDGDGTHNSPAGQIAIGGGFIPVLQQILG